MEICLSLGDSLEVLSERDDCSVDSIVTDPPYGLGNEPDAVELMFDWVLRGAHLVKGKGFMGNEWDAFVPQPILWSECHRVLKPGGHLLSFGGTRTFDLLSLALRLAGFEYRDTIMWVYGEGMPKSHNISKAINKQQGSNSSEEWNGWGTNLKPCYEPILMFRKPLDGNVAENVLQWRTGGINIDATRVPTDDAVVRPSVARDDNLVYGKGLGAGTQEEPSGRWPSNFVHDGSDEVLSLFPVTGPSKKASRGKGIDGPTFKNKNGSGNGVRGHDDNGGSAARFFYCAKASRSERDAGLDDLEMLPGGEMSGTKDGSLLTGSGNKRDNQRKNIHPSVKPVSLMRWLVKMVTPPGGLVLDPFMGSGTTGIACVMEGFDFWGIDKDEYYTRIADARIQHWRNQSTKKIQKTKVFPRI